MITYSKYEMSEEFPNKKVKVLLEAKLRFKDEVAPMNLDIIKKRMYSDKRFFLNHYLADKEKLRWSSMNNKYLDERNEVLISNRFRNLKIKNRSRKAGIDIKVTSNHGYLLKELLDLNKLNDFILKGN